MYSIIIPYRNREEHLTRLLPKLISMFTGKDYEIIVAEQETPGKFLKSCLWNEAFKRAKGDVLILHDVDYYPTDNVSYEADDFHLVYPVRNVVFLTQDFKERPYEDVPAGYRHFRKDVGNHSGGVIVVTRRQFELLNGFNPMYIGWGKEDDDFRDRAYLCGFPPIRRETGMFYGLYHKDTAPDPNDEDFRRNCIIHNEFFATCGLGYRQTRADVSEHTLDGMNSVRWLKIKNMQWESLKLASFQIPSRKRPVHLVKSIESIIQQTTDLSRVEILLRVDDDDADTIAVLDKLPKDITIKCKVGPRGGAYADIYKWHNEMFLDSCGTFVMVFTDDTTIGKYGYDNALVPYRNTPIIIGATVDPEPTYDPKMIYPIIHRAIPKTFKQFSYHTSLDRQYEWVSMATNAFVKSSDIVYENKAGLPAEHVKDGIMTDPGGVNQYVPFIKDDVERFLSYINRKLNGELA